MVYLLIHVYTKLYAHHEPSREPAKSYILLFAILNVYDRKLIFQIFEICEPYLQGYNFIDIFYFFFYFNKVKIQNCGLPLSTVFKFLPSR